MAIRFEKHQTNIKDISDHCTTKIGRFVLTKAFASVIMLFVLDKVSDTKFGKEVFVMNVKVKSFKTLAVILAIVCVLAFIAPTLASGHTTGHDCKGEDCLLCLAVSMSSNTLRFLMILASAIAIISIFAVAYRAFITVESSSVIETPVRLKVKLSD